MSDHVKQLLQLDMKAIQKIDSNLRPADRLMLHLCSDDAKHFNRPINIARCAVSIHEGFAKVTLSEDYAHVIDFVVDLKNKIEFGENGAKKENIFYLKSKKGEFAVVEFGSRRGLFDGIQEMKVNDFFRDLPRFISHLHTICPWPGMIKYGFNRKKLVDLEQLYTHNELPFAITFGGAYRGYRSGLLEFTGIGRIYSGRYEYEVVPENRHELAKIQYYETYNTEFFKNWQSGRHSPVSINALHLKSYAETFGGLIGLGMRKDGDNRFMMFSDNQPSGRNMLVAKKENRKIDITTSAAPNQYGPILKLIEEKHELEKEFKELGAVTRETRTTKVTRKRTLEEVTRFEEVEERLKALRKQFREENITFYCGIAILKQ